MLPTIHQLSHLLPWSPRVATPTRTPRRARPNPPRALVAQEPKPLPALAEELAESCHPCGWFDSSHELQCGLMVLEHAGPESLVDVMPPGPWLDLYATLPSPVRC